MSYVWFYSELDPAELLLMDTETEVALLHCTKFYFGKYSRLFLDFCIKISRRLKFFPMILLPTMFMFLFFLAHQLFWQLLCFCLPHQTGCPQSSALCQPISLPEKEKIMVPVKQQKKDNIGQILFCLTMLYIQKSCLKSMELV